MPRRPARSDRESGGPPFAHQKHLANMLRVLAGSRRIEASRRARCGTDRAGSPLFRPRRPSNGGSPFAGSLKIRVYDEVDPYEVYWLIMAAFGIAWTPKYARHRIR